MGLSALPGHAECPLGLFSPPPIRATRQIRGFPAVFRDFREFRSFCPPHFGPLGLPDTPDVGFLRFQDHFGINAADFLPASSRLRARFQPARPLFPESAARRAVDPSPIFRYSLATQEISPRHIKPTSGRSDKTVRIGKQS